MDQSQRPANLCEAVGAPNRQGIEIENRSHIDVRATVKCGPVKCVVPTIYRG